MLTHDQLFVTPWTVTWQLPLSTGFPRQEWRSRLPFPSPEDLPNWGMEPVSPALQADSLWLSHQGSPFSLVHIFCCSVTKSHLTLCDPVTCSTPVFLFLNYLSEFAPIQGHWVNDTIQPSHPLSPTLLLPLIFPRIRVLSNGSALCIRWPEYRSFNFSISPSNEYSRLVSFLIISLLSKGLSRVFSNTTFWEHCHARCLNPWAGEKSSKTMQLTKREVYCWLESGLLSHPTQWCGVREPRAQAVTQIYRVSISSW